MALYSQSWAFLQFKSQQDMTNVEACVFAMRRGRRRHHRPMLPPFGTVAPRAKFQQELPVVGQPLDPFPRRIERVGTASADDIVAVDEVLELEQTSAGRSEPSGERVGRHNCLLFLESGLTLHQGTSNLGAMCSLATVRRLKCAMAVAPGY